MESRREHDTSTTLFSSTLTDNGQEAQAPPPRSLRADDELVQRLRMSEARYRSLLTATAQIVWTTSVDGRTPGDMVSWCQYTGQDPQTLDSERVIEAIHPDDRGRLLRVWLNAVEQQSAYETTYRLRRADGVYRVFSARGVPVLDEEGTVGEWVGACNDITQQQQLEEQLRESEQRFRLTFELAAVGIAHVGLDGRWLRVNQRLCDIFGYPREELQALTFQAITHPDDVAEGVAQLQSVVAGELPEISLEKRYIRKDGTLVWAYVKASLARTAEHEPAYFISVIEDISARKQAEQEREQLLERERAARVYAETVIDTITDGIFVYDTQGKILQSNAAARSIFTPSVQADYTSLPYAEEVRDEQGHILRPGQYPTDRILRGEVFKDGRTLEVSFTRQDGVELHISASGAPFHDAQGQIAGGVMVFRNVTERRKLARRTQEALRGLLDMAESLVQIPAAEQDEQQPNAERTNLRATGQRIAELTRNVLDCRRVGIEIIEPTTGRIIPLAVLGLSPPEERAWWIEQELPTNTIHNSPTPALIAQLRNGQTTVLDLREPAYRSLPNSYNIQVILIAPMCVQEQLVGLLALDYDSTEHQFTEDEVALASAVAKLSALVFQRERLIRERAEARGRELAMRQARDRMEEFLGIASHELRTPMTTIKANIQLALRRLATLTHTDDTLTTGAHKRIEGIQEMLARAERQVGVLDRLVGDLLDISRIQTGKLQLHLRPEPCNLVSIAQEAVQEQRKATPTRTIELDLSYYELLPIYADPDRIAQVLTNYMSNALKYSPSDRPILIQLEKVLHQQEGQPARPLARVSVRDEGPGLPLEEQQRIWDCFYQVHGIEVLSGSGVGLGLGLHISQALIQRHSGAVGVTSTPPHGSTFWFTLPLASNI